MLKQIVLLSVIGLGFVACSDHGDQGYVSTEPIVEVPFTGVHLTDYFWAPRIEVNRTVSIPSAFRQCEINGRFDNFALAGVVKGEHKGDSHLTIPIRIRLSKEHPIHLPLNMIRSWMLIWIVSLR